MVSTASPEPPRGSNVWVGLDELGTETVSRLGRWFVGDGIGKDLAAANRLLPNLRISTPADIAVPGITPVVGPAKPVMPVEDVTAHDPAADRIQQALGEVLSAQQSRAALAWADRELLVPHVWIVADLTTPDLGQLAPWLVALERRLRTLKVEARIYLLFRYLSWAATPETQIAAEQRLQALVTETITPGRHGQGTTLALVASDRDGIGGLYSPEETSALIQRFTDLILLGDVAHRNRGEIFAEQVIDQDVPWLAAPAFGSMAGVSLVWDAPALFRQNAERRRARIFAALDTPVPHSFEPACPQLAMPDLVEGRWPVLDSPRWSPRFWQPPTREYARATRTSAAWLGLARRWRHDMLVIHEDRRSHLENSAAVTLHDYVENLDDVERTALDDESLPGFFPLLRRVLERAAADIRVRISTLPTDLDDPLERLDAPNAITDPGSIVSSGEERLARVLERRINPLLLAQVGLFTFLITWGLIVLALRNLPDSLIGWLLVRVASIGLVPAEMQEWARQVADWRPPSDVQIAFWSGLVLGGVIIMRMSFSIMTQRVAVERAWKGIHDRARDWRDAAISVIAEDLAKTERKLVLQNLDEAAGEIAARQEQLQRTQALGRRPVEAVLPPDSAVSAHIEPVQPPPPPLSDLQAAQIVRAYRQAQRNDPAFRAAPRNSVHELFALAARIAGDAEPDLRIELPLVQRRFLSAIPPDGAIRIPQLDSTVRAELAPLQIVRYLAMPARVAGDIAAVDGTERVPIPVDDRFYALSVQTGMSARRVLSLPHDHTLREIGDQPAAAGGGH